MAQTYERCMVYELNKLSLSFEVQKHVPILYKGVDLDARLRFDILVENQVVVELKTVEYMLPVFDAQLLTYMKLFKKPKGILINFNTTNIFHEDQHILVIQIVENLPKE